MDTRTLLHQLQRVLCRKWNILRKEIDSTNNVGRLVFGVSEQHSGQHLLAERRASATVYSSVHCWSLDFAHVLPFVLSRPTHLS
jgi:hypothetical protein